MGRRCAAGAAYNRAIMASSPDICIRGAGIVGRTLALLLARERLRVALVGRAPPAPGHGDVRAYALNARARALLEDLRVWPDEASATPVHEMRVVGPDGGVLRFEAAAQAVEALNWIVDVPALEARLAEAVRYQPLIDERPEPVPAPLTVVCEGRASDTRAALGVPFDVTAYPQHALATRVECAEPHGQVARQWFDDGHILAFLPLDGAAGRRVAVVWSLPAERVAERLALDDAMLAAELHAASRGELGELRLAGARAAWPLQRARAERWTGAMPGAPSQSWVLAGDAAHAMHPLAGQGLNVGLGDAAELAQVLRQREYWRPVGDRKLLRRYERARQIEVRRMLAVTDTLQQLYGRDAGPLAALRDWGLRGFAASGPLKRGVARQAMQ